MQEVNLRFEALGQRDVVSIHQGDVLAARLCQARVQCAGPPAVDPMLEKADALIALRIIADDLCRVVLRPVIDDDELEVAEGLRQDAVDGFGQVRFAIVDGHED